MISHLTRLREALAPVWVTFGWVGGGWLVVARAEDVGITHETMLTGWPRLRGWLDDGAAHAAMPERLAVAAADWQEHSRDPVELYAKTRLQVALDTAAATPQDLTPRERAVLADSSEQADRQFAEESAASLPSGIPSRGFVASA